MAIKTVDSRMMFVEIIDGIFGRGVLGDNVPGNINLDVMILTNNLLNQIRLGNRTIDELLSALVLGAAGGLGVALTGPSLIVWLTRSVGPL